MKSVSGAIAKTTIVSANMPIAAADIILLLVDHRPFRALKAADLKEKVLIDTRGVVA